MAEPKQDDPFPVMDFFHVAALADTTSYLATENHDGEKLDFHALRHTCRAWFALAGAHPKSIQSVMRHSSITLTMDTYGHLIPGQEAETVARFSDVMGSDQSNVMRAIGTMDERAGGSSKPSEKRSGRRSELGAMSCVSDARPCHDDQQADAPDETCNPLPFGELSNVV